MLLWASLVALPLVAALTAQDVGKVDFHLPMLGALTAPIAVSRDTCFAAANTTLAALDCSTGNLHWRQDVGVPIVHLDVADSKLYVAGETGLVQCWREDGYFEWEKEPSAAGPGVFRHAVLTHDNSQLSASLGADSLAVQTQDGSAKSYPARGGSRVAAVRGGFIYMHDNALYRVATGKPEKLVSNCRDFAVTGSQVSVRLNDGTVNVYPDLDLEAAPPFTTHALFCSLVGPDKAIVAQHRSLRLVSRTDESHPVVWERDESLVDARHVVAIVTAAERPRLGRIAAESYARRVSRHASELRAFILRLGGMTSPPASQIFHHMLLIFATESQVIAIDTTDNLPFAKRLVWKADVPSSIRSIEAKGPHVVVNTDENTAIEFDGLSGRVRTTQPQQAVPTAEMKDDFIVGTNESYKYSLGHALASAGNVEPWPISHGRVLGDRRVLYKYVNGNTVAAAWEVEGGKLVVSVVDTMTGAEVYASEHSDADTKSHPVAIVLSGNWLVYSFWRPGGSVMVSCELYESDKPNQHSVGARPAAVCAAYVLPFVPSALGVTRTAQGISSRDVLAYIPSLHAVAAVSQRQLDPRRPLLAGRKLTAEEQEEGLTPYEPVVLPGLLSHEYSVFLGGEARLAAFPTRLESTSVVVAYGHDVFVARTAPSRAFDVLSASFNKYQLMLTVVALLAAMAVSRPMVSRKKLRDMWAAGA